MSRNVLDGFYFYFVKLTDDPEGILFLTEHGS